MLGIGASVALQRGLALSLTSPKTIVLMVACGATSSWLGRDLDCFAALAMTAWKQLRAKTPLLCPGRGAALLQRYVAEPGPTHQRCLWLPGSRLCAATEERCSASGTQAKALTDTASSLL
ncbi:hypothetical protein GCM10007857_23080 [Bradyrhizobium iriomotense]|uniref:Uncharacterized protein n=1 Tax=Bradyrhizobium iriomotense TaxID=441950 RepID=A0ABQ6ATP4_9BRAD|nr:hypothetical protein GCM10007857_23080 [Bradyrhizobium iriomotense]